MAEGDRLAKHLQELELEIEKTKVDINYQESVVADKQVIADALLRFQEVVKILPAEDQKELIGLIVREISVNQCDPKTKVEAVVKGVFKTKIRTKWYSVNISLYASDLIPKGYDFGKISSDLKKIGSAGIDRSRTFWNLAVTVGIPFSRWGASPFIAKPLPFRCSENGQAPNVVPPTPVKPECIHPFLIALKWREQMAEDPGLNLATIAAREGLSRARVTQIMNLLALPDQLQQLLRCHAPNVELRAFSERRLRELLSRKGHDVQVEEWQQWLSRLQTVAAL